MSETYQCATEGGKRTSEAPTEQLDTLEWARDFMDKYEKRTKMVRRLEETLPRRQ